MRIELPEGVGSACITGQVDFFPIFLLTLALQPELGRHQGAKQEGTGQILEFVQLGLNACRLCEEDDG